MRAPDDPFVLTDSLPQPSPAARREVVLLGTQVEVVLQTERATRQGRPGAGRPAFQAQRADRIIKAEAIWESDGLALTPTRYPFARDQLLLWSKTRRREPSTAMLELAFGWEESAGATVLANSMGAAASVTRSHLHVCNEGFAFLGGLQHEAIDPAEVHLAPRPGIEVLRLRVPILGIGLRGEAAARARGMAELLERRTTPAFNLVSGQGCSWLFPRSGVETPEPQFCQALGAAEFAGRWVCNDEAGYESLDAERMLKALQRCGVPAGQ